MEFRVENEVFSELPNLCFGVVVARGLKNGSGFPHVEAFLQEGIDSVRQSFQNVNLKEHARLLPYRQSFQKLGYNPNKFLCSIEALTARLVKGGQLPNINAIVDLANAISLKWILPIGAHDMDHFEGDIMVRFSRAGDTFTPFGSTEAESVDSRELVYASGKKIKTRKWIWRQSDEGKITPESKNIFFPIDGFQGVNDEAVMFARDELASKLGEVFACQVKTGFVDINNGSLEL